MIKLTQEHYAEFKKECKFWINKYGLQGWEVTYNFSDNLIDREITAHCSVSFSNRWATIELATSLDEDVSEGDMPAFIRRMAFHECTHLFLAGLYELVTSRTFNQDRLDSEEHNVVRTLENCLFKEIDKLNHPSPVKHDNCCNL